MIEYPSARGAWIVTLLVAGLVGPAAAHGPVPPRAGASPLSATPHLAVIKPAPDFVLRDLDGAAVRLADLRGRPVLVSFIYTHCTTVCPLLSARVAALQRRLAALPAVRRPALLSITVDPERDSAAELRRYATRFAADRTTWRFLRDDPAALAPVLHAWGEWARPTADGEIDHPARVHLIDAAGRIREIYSLQFFDDRQAWLDMQALLRER
ncbi:MAG: SCO family protein [Candidatus Rokubacteria bacterium]|nr:SCO family protein [Candidatus Rokubacteria bacterium]